MRTPIGFAAPDHQSVSELFVLLVSDDADHAAHLELLALLAEVFSDGTFHARLAGATVRSVFNQWIDQRSSRAGATVTA